MRAKGAPETKERMKPRTFDKDKAAQAVRELLIAVGEDPERPGLCDTPERVARMYEEILSGAGEDPAEHLRSAVELEHDEMIIVRDIPLYSVCEHHLLPFVGRAHVAYIPARGRLTGLSKLARVVNGYARRLQVQERLTSQIADAIVRKLAPQGVMVVIEAEHLCMTMRGVRSPGSVTVTSAVRGVLQKNPATRAEALSLIRGRVDAG